MLLAVFLDTETSGLDPFAHDVFEIAMKIVDLQTGKRLGTFSSIISHDERTFNKADANSLRVNGFTYDLLQEGKPMQWIKEKVLRFFQTFQIKRGKAVFICQNPSFDRSFFYQIIELKLHEKLKLPYHWLDLASMFFGANAKESKLPWGLGLSKDHIATFLDLPKEKSPHRAEQGVDHLLLCYQKLIGFPANILPSQNG